MKCFPLLKTVLDEVWAELPGSLSEKEVAVREKLEYLRTQYKELVRTKTQIDYRDPVTRYAYLGAYVTSHANIVYTRIGRSDQLKKLFENERVKITCIGGGPGSDLLGVLKYTDELDDDDDRERSLKFFLFDRELAWSPSWSDVDDKLGARASTYFQPFDVVDESTWRSNPKYLASDLFTMIYFISEIYRLREQAAVFFTHLFDNAKSGSLFLFVDNAHSAFFNWFDSLYKDRGVSVLTSVDDAEVKMPYEEEKRDMGEHAARTPPKLMANIAYRILRKD